MITISSLGTRGNLGNQLFQIASIIGIAKKHQQDYFFPKWQYTDYFENGLPEGDLDNSFIHLKDREFNYHKWNITANANYDLEGWLQTEKYFDIKKTREIFKFRDDFTSKTLAKHGSIFEKKTILISVRRGDFVNNSHFFQLSYRFYLLAIVNNFPDYKDRTLVFTSDDINYCKFHYSFLKNAIFLENVPPMEQIVLGINCDDYIISNSTFSWWLAWLGENENKRIYRPIKNLAGDFGRINNDKDYFPERWIAFDEEKYSLTSNFTILICKGSIYSLLVDVKHLYKVKLESSKKIVKKIIGNE
ncbi:MAG: alpha-1,2-fucosyltransferase [Flavobacterium sp.]|nr:alpha-1,2-fucosyltransferase [Flavobacterium sp.]